MPEENGEDEDIDSPVDLIIKDPTVKWNLSITTYPYPTLSLTPHETITLAWLFAEFPPPVDLNSLQENLKKNLLSDDEIAAAEEMSKKLYARGGFVFRETNYLDKLRAAVLEESKVEIKYNTGQGKEVNWLIWPYGLIFYAGNAAWYLVARKEETREIVACHLGRIHGVKMLNEQFVYPEEFSLHYYLRKRWGMDMSHSEVVRVRFYNEANVVEKVKRGFKSHGLSEPEKLADGTLEYHGKICGIHNFAKWVLSFGSSAEVLEPEWLRNEMISTARLWYELYDEVD